VGRRLTEYARLSANSESGLIGWENHELVWRSHGVVEETNRRAALVRELYSCGDRAGPRDRGRGRIPLVAIGALERADFAEETSRRAYRRRARVEPPAGGQVVRIGGIARWRRRSMMAEPSAGTPELTVVIPAYNEEESIEPMVERLVLALEQRVEGLEILFVDDGSRDGTWRRISELAGRDPRVRGIRFARNFGHQAALTAGVDAATGQAVVIIDADLQDPPEVIPEMIERWRAGAEVVYGQREVREGETLFKKATAAAFYRLLRRITHVDIPVDTGDFRLMGPRAAAAFRALPERNRFIRGLVAWIGFPRSRCVPPQRRHAGETKYPCARWCASRSTASPRSRSCRCALRPGSASRCRCCPSCTSRW
jgi:hypothetical protein